MPSKALTPKTLLWAAKQCQSKCKYYYVTKSKKKDLGIFNKLARRSCFENFLHYCYVLLHL